MTVRSTMKSYCKIISPAYGEEAHVDFADEVFSSVTLSAVGAIIYNDTNSDKLVVVLDFGGTKTATNGDFTIQFPAAGASSSIIRIA